MVRDERKSKIEKKTNEGKHGCSRTDKAEGD